MVSFLHNTPFFRLLIGYIIGILLFQLVRLPTLIIGVMVATSIGTVMWSFWLRSATAQYRWRWLFGTGISLLFVVMGYLNCLYIKQQQRFSALNQQGTYLIEVTSAPEEKLRSYKCEVKLISQYDEDSTQQEAKGKAILFLEKDSIKPHILIGDFLLINGTFRPPNGVQNPNGFDYAQYLDRQGIQATLYLPTHQWKKANITPKTTLSRLANEQRNKLLNIYKQYGFEGSAFGLLSAITLGYTDEIEMEVKQHFAQSGASHILAISGLHIGIIYGVFFLALGFLGNSRKVRIRKAIVIVLIIWVFAFITGLSPAVNRAAVMLTLFAGGTCVERKPQIYNTVCVSALLMLLINPNLLYNIGFQLSYVAVVSIVFYQKRFKNLLSVRNKPMRWAWELTTVSVAAQIGTAPLAMYYFHQFPNYFLLTNFIAIPLTTVIIYLSMLLVLFAPLTKIATLIAYFLHLFVEGLLWSMAYIAGLPYAIYPVGIGVWQFILLFFIIVFLTIFIVQKKGKYLIYTLISVFLCTILSSYRDLKTWQTVDMIVFANRQATIINLLDYKQNIVLTTDTATAYRTVKGFWLTNNYPPPSYQNLEEEKGMVFFVHNKQKIGILSNDFMHQKIATTPLTLDWLIITNQIKPNMEKLFVSIHPKGVIIDSAIAPWVSQKIIQECQKKGIKYYSVDEKGAFRLKNETNMR